MAGLLVAALVTAVGSAFALTRPARWSANSSLLVLPRTDLDPDLVAGYYDTLSRGQIVNTYAQILRLQSLADTAARGAGLSPAAAEQVEVDVRPVPDAAVIDVYVTAATAGDAERVADGVVSAAVSYIAQLRSPYVLSTVSAATGTARRTGLGVLTVVGLVAIVGAVVGAAVQQGLWLLATRRQRRLPRGVHAGAASPDRPVADRHEAGPEVRARWSSSTP